MKILYGTTNPAKLRSMREALADLPLELIGLNDLNIEIPKVTEDGSSPLENARKKASLYSQLTDLPVFSCDSGLYIEGLSEEEQPGVMVRRIHVNALKHHDEHDFEEMTDDEMIAYYSKVAAKLGGSAVAHYENAISFWLNPEQVFEKQGGNLSSMPFIIASEPHPKREKGFPLDCLSKTKESQQYYYDLPEQYLELICEVEGFKRFFEKALYDIRLAPFTLEHAQAVCDWRYEAPYGVYNMSPWEQVVENHWTIASEVFREENFVSIYLGEEWIGFGRIELEEESQIVSLGIGLKPESCGNGYGDKAMSCLVVEAKKRYPAHKIGLEVRQFNKRAKKCYERIGFRTNRVYMKETINGFIAYEYMELCVQQY